MLIRNFLREVTYGSQIIMRACCIDDDRLFDGVIYTYSYSVVCQINYRTLYGIGLYDFDRRSVKTLFY
jgi:hypothetical protein